MALCLRRNIVGLGNEVRGAHTIPTLFHRDPDNSLPRDFCILLEDQPLWTHPSCIIESPAVLSTFAVHNLVGSSGLWLTVGFQYFFLIMEIAWPLHLSLAVSCSVVPVGLSIACHFAVKWDSFSLGMIGNDLSSKLIFNLRQVENRHLGLYRHKFKKPHCMTSSTLLNLSRL